MPHVHLSNVPLHARWRPGNIESLFEAMLVNSIDVVYPYRYPRSFVCAFIAIRAERHFVVTFASAALTSFAEKNLAISRADATETRRVAPIPRLLPAELFEPGEALPDIRDIEYWCEPFCAHVPPQILQLQSNIAAQPHPYRAAHRRKNIATAEGR